MKKDPLKIQTHFILGILFLQYLFGMFANLFVQFPDTKNETALWEFARGQVAVMIHIIIAFLLLIAAVVLLIRSIRRKDKSWVTGASVGLFWILVAFISGVRFIPTQEDLYSFFMSVAFILAFLSYGWVLYRTKK